MLFAVQGRYCAMAIMLVGIATCKENLLLYIVGFAPWLLSLGAPLRVVALTCGLPIAAFVIELQLVAPAFRGGGYRHFYFEQLGASFGEVLLNAMRSPARVFALLFAPEAKIAGLLLPLVSTGFLGLAAPLALAPLVPGVVERFASTFANTWWGHHYGAPSHAIAVCAAVIGAGRLASACASAVPRVALALSQTLFLCTLLCSFAAPWGTSDLFVLRKPYHPSVADAASMAAAVASVPPHAAVAAQNYLLPHLAARERIYLLEEARQADFVAMTPSTNPWPYDRAYHDALAQALLREGWRVHFCAGNSFELARAPGPSVACSSLAP
jgi:hypothetical protein